MSSDLRVATTLPITWAKYISGGIHEPQAVHKRKRVGGTPHGGAAIRHYSQIL